METIRESLNRKVQEELKDLLKAKAEEQEARETLPAEILDFPATYTSASIYSNTVFLYLSPDSSVSEPEQFNWVAQVKLWLTDLLKIKWNKNPEASSWNGETSWHGEGKLFGKIIYVTVRTPRPPHCTVRKITTKEVKETESTKYEIECPPDPSEAEPTFVPPGGGVPANG